MSTLNVPLLVGLGTAANIAANTTLDGEVAFGTDTHGLYIRYSGTVYTVGGGGMTIGSPVSGSVHNGVLYVDGSGNLAQDQTSSANYFQYGVTSGVLSWSDTTVNQVGLGIYPGGAGGQITVTDANGSTATIGAGIGEASFNMYDASMANAVIFVYLNLCAGAFFDAGGNSVCVCSDSGGTGAGNALAIQAEQTTVSGSVSGAAVFSQPLGGCALIAASWMRVIIYLNALNGTASYTFPTPFTFTPAILTTNGPAASHVTSLNTTNVTVTGSTTTGFIFLEGY